MKVLLPQRKTARIEMLPLIDVVFLLLVVFIYALLSMAVHRGLPVALPQSNQTAASPPGTLTVTIKADGKTFVDRQPVRLDQLTARLAPASARDKPPTILLFADRELSYQRLFEVLDRIREAGLHQVSLQAQADSPR